MASYKGAVSVVTNPGDSTTAAEFLAANSNRVMASVHNLSTAVLYLLVGAGTATATNHTVRLAQYDYYETPEGVKARLSGVWASDAGGTAVVTEVT